MAKLDACRINPKEAAVKEITIPLKLLDKELYPNLSLTAIMIYSYLCALPRQKDKYGREYAELTLLDGSRVFGCVPATITNGLGSLRREGLIESKKDYGGNNRHYILENNNGKGRN